MIPCSGYFRVERGYEIEKSIFNLIIGKSEGIDIEFRIEILDGQIATLVNHRDRSGGVGCTWKYIINQSGVQSILKFLYNQPMKRMLRPL